MGHKAVGGPPTALLSEHHGAAGVACRAPLIWVPDRHLKSRAIGAFYSEPPQATAGRALCRGLMMRGRFVAKAHNRVRSISNGKEAGLCHQQHDHKIKV
jgi:hypothetical protein